MREFDRREGESKFSYCKRLAFGIKGKLYDLSYVDFFNLVFGIELSETEARKRFYGIIHLLDMVEEENIDVIEDSDTLNDIDDKIKELQKERYKLQTEKLEYNRWLREQSRLEMFEEKIIDTLKDIKPIQVPNYKIEYSKDEMGAIVGFADCHYGKELIITGLEGEVLNEYNIEIFEKRMWRLLNEIINKSEKESIKHINVFDLGDDIEGMIRISQLMSLRYGVTDSIIHYGNFILSWLNELSNYLSVDYYQTQGNHSDLRLLTNKKGDFPHENSEKIINWFIENMLKDNPNIKVHNNKIPMIYTKVVGFDVLALHGQNEKDLEKSIKDFSFLYGKNIDYMITGHKHSEFCKEVGINKSVIQVPSVMGIDDFSMSLKKSASPAAKMIILEKDYGKVLDYNLKLN